MRLNNDERRSLDCPSEGTTRDDSREDSSFNGVRLTYKFDTVLLKKVRIVLAHVPSGDLYELGNMLDAYYASARAYHERHTSGQIARAWTDIKCLGAVEQLIGEDGQCICMLQKTWAWLVIGLNLKKCILSSMTTICAARRCLKKSSNQIWV